jgi:hypothetical protein
MLLEIWQVNINPAYQTPELHYCLTKVRVKALIAPESFKTQQYYKMVCHIAPEVDSCAPGQICSKRLPDLTSLIIISDNQLPWVYWIALYMISPSGIIVQDFIVACEHITVNLCSHITESPTNCHNLQLDWKTFSKLTWAYKA